MTSFKLYDEFEASERKKLRGFCEQCDNWIPFSADAESWVCPVHKHKFSNKHGLQVSTLRTPTPAKKRGRKR